MKGDLVKWFDDSFFDKFLIFVHESISHSINYISCPSCDHISNKVQTTLLQVDRTSEWFVPKFGSKKFRISIGILFLPYTSIVTCFAALGAISGPLQLERVAAICVIYVLALGVGAHLLDAVGGKTKPWGNLPKRKIGVLALVAVGIAFSVGIYFAFLDSPWLFPIGIIEGFFLFAYSLELFGGKFHNNPSTIFSWGILPVFAGSVIQTNSITIETIIIASITALVTYALIKTSRQYKLLKRDNGDAHIIKKKERILKLITIGVIASTIIFFIIRYYNFIWEIPKIQMNVKYSEGKLYKKDSFLE